MPDPRGRRGPRGPRGPREGYIMRTKESARLSCSLISNDNSRGGDCGLIYSLDHGTIISIS